MSVRDLYSYRKRIASGKVPDVFVYDRLPDQLRAQIVHIWRDSIGRFVNRSDRILGISPPSNNDGWIFIHNTFAREHGVLNLTNDPTIDQQCINFLQYETSVDSVLDLIEVSFQYIECIPRIIGPDERKSVGIRVGATEAISELNERFRRAGVGYRFENGQILRVDSELIHSQVVRPALRYLHHPGFKGPRDEFMKAHAHYRAGEMKDAITDANNAFESTLKTICEQRGWICQPGARASDLLKVVRSKGLLPNYLDKSFDQLVATLKSGLPKLRNEEGAHGQGASPRKTPDYLAAYALHLAAANILLLIEAHETTKSLGT